MMKLAWCVAVLVSLCARAEAGQPEEFDFTLPSTLRTLPARGEPILVRGLLVSPDTRVDVELRRFSITDASTRFVAHTGGVDTPLAYDADRVVLLGGRVLGRTESSVFIAITPSMGVIGRIDDGAGHIASIASMQTQEGPSPDICTVIPGPILASHAAAPSCGVDSGAWIEPELPSPNLPADYLAEVAVDTDYDYFELFDDTDHAMDYLVALYGQASFVFSRDSRIALKLTFTRLWTDADDLFNGGDPLGDFRRYWNQNMDDVPRDTAQFCSGRRDFPFGGSAYLPGVCELGRAYSCVGYIGGDISNPRSSHDLNFDVIVTAHELGHNFGTPHTHDRGLDDCANPFAAPQRGPIMSYCGQSYSGGHANQDPRFHTDSTRLMHQVLSGTFCIDADRNANGIADATDIALGDSSDLNANGIPDEAEDCNGNGTLDDQDIASGVSLDLNGNGIPDECEPDCNANNVPDDLDIAMGDAEDGDANGVPDACQVDCDANGIADSLDINADMALDRDRNAVLDGCQDCDGDGVNDLLALDHEYNMWIGSLESDSGVREFFGASGVLMQVAEPTAIETVHDLMITQDRRVLLASATDSRIVEFAADGSVVGDLVASGAGGLDEPGGMLLTDTTLLVADRGGGRLLEFDLGSGAFMRVVAVLPATPFGLAHAPGGGVLVSLDDDTVREYDIAMGVLRRVVVDSTNNGGLTDPRGLVIDTLGRLLVCSYGTDEVLAYAFDTGAPLGKFNHNGTANRLTLEEPWTIRVGPNNNVFVSNSHIHQDRLPSPNLHLTQARVFEFDYRLGNYVRAFLQGVDTGLWRPSGFDFMPGGNIDCNHNFFPDTCEIAMGLADDVNGDGVPDDCQTCVPDIDGSGSVDTNDFFAFLAAYQAQDPAADFTGDGDVNTNDFFAFLVAYQAGC